MTSKKEIIKLLYKMADYHDTDLSPTKADRFADDLMGVELFYLEQAWKKYRMNPANGNRFPSPGQLMALVDDGRPSAQTSWAMIGRDDDTSFMWTEEMREAWNFAYPHLRNSDGQSAWFTYKENYDRLVAEKRFNRVQVKWTPSFGFNKSGREDCMIKAIQEKKILPELAVKYCPELEENTRFQVIIGQQPKTALLENKNTKGLEQINPLKLIEEWKK